MPAKTQAATHKLEHNQMLPTKLARHEKAKTHTGQHPTVEGDVREAGQFDRSPLYFREASATGWAEEWGKEKFA